MDLSPRSARLSRSFTVRGRWLIQTLSSLSTKMPPICPKIQLFGSGLGQLASISNFGACCATAAAPMNANAATPASASVRASFMNSSSLCASLLQLEFDEFEACRAGVLDAALFARVLPDEVAVIGGHPPIGIARNDFRKHASMHIDAQARRGLRDLSGRLAGLQDHAPSAHPRVIHDLGEAGNAGAV